MSDLQKYFPHSSRSQERAYLLPIDCEGLKAIDPEKVYLSSAVDAARAADKAKIEELESDWKEADEARESWRTLAIDRGAVIERLTESARSEYLARLAAEKGWQENTATIERMRRALDWLNSNIIFCNYMHDGKTWVLSPDLQRSNGKCWIDVPADLADLIKAQP